MVNKVKIKCIKHGYFYQSPKSHINQSQGCPLCRSSKGEIKILNYLDKNNIKCCPQYKFKDCKNIKPLPFDFYLPDHNILIEFDGEQHYFSIDFFGGEENFSYIKNNDKIKTDYCFNNNIKLIRIKYTDKIEEILKNNL